MISVIIPVYRQTKYLERCLASVLWQLNPEDNCVLVVDEPPDAVVRQILEYNPPKLAVILLTSPTPRGPAAARNVGVKETVRSNADTSPSGQWIKFLDADDVLAPYALESFRQTKVPENIHVIAGQQIKVVSGMLMGDSYTDWSWIDRVNPSLVSMCFIRREAFDAVGGFDERIHFEEDWDLWLKLRREYMLRAFAVVKWPVCYYWRDAQEQREKQRDHNVEGMDVRQYLSKQYGIRPQGLQ